MADVLEDDLQVLWDTKAETDKIIGMMAPIHLARVDEARTRSASSGERVVKGLFRRSRDASRWEIRDDDIAGCLRTAGGGSSIQRVLVVARDVVRSRRQSPREYARLMGLPEICGNAPRKQRIRPSSYCPFPP